MIKCHGQLAGTGGEHQLNHPRHFVLYQGLLELTGLEAKIKWRNKQADIADRAMKLNMIFAM